MTNVGAGVEEGFGGSWEWRGDGRRRGSGGGEGGRVEGQIPGENHFLHWQGNQGPWDGARGGDEANGAAPRDAEERRPYHSGLKGVHHWGVFIRLILCCHYLSNAFDFMSVLCLARRNDFALASVACRGQNPPDLSV